MTGKLERSHEASSEGSPSNGRAAPAGGLARSQNSGAPFRTRSAIDRDSGWTFDTATRP
jgi:hypothetical protein